jgi:hypothetical protein
MGVGRLSKAIVLQQRVIALLPVADEHLLAAAEGGASGEGEAVAEVLVGDFALQETGGAQTAATLAPATDCTACTGEQLGKELHPCNLAAAGGCALGLLGGMLRRRSAAQGRRPMHARSNVTRQGVTEGTQGYGPWQYAQSGWMQFCLWLGVPGGCSAPHLHCAGVVDCIHHWTHGVPLEFLHTWQREDSQPL